MAEYRRYRPRQKSTSSNGWGRWVVILLVGIGVVVLARVVFVRSSGSSTNTTGATNTATSEIQLTTDTTNTSVATLNTNSPLNTNSATVSTAADVWKTFSTTSCTTAISTRGTAKRVVLTIGFSAANDSVAQVLDRLKQANVPADFFVSGSFALKNPETVRSASQAGYAVYSQSYDSTDLTTFNETELKNTIDKTEAAIIDATGVTPKPILRPPAGSYTTATLKTLRQAGYCAVLWTVDAYDWQEGMTVAQAQERVMTAVKKQAGGSIVALHAGYDITPELITTLAAQLKTEGYEIVTLAALLNP